MLKYSAVEVKTLFSSNQTALKWIIGLGVIKRGEVKRLIPGQDQSSASLM